MTRAEFLEAASPGDCPAIDPPFPSRTTRGSVVIGPHSRAVEAAIAATRGLTAADEPLLELARTLARQVDAAGPDGPGTRLAAAYLTTIRTLMARLGPAMDGPRPVSIVELPPTKLQEAR